MSKSISSVLDGFVLTLRTHLRARLYLNLMINTDALPANSENAMLDAVVEA